MKKLILLAAIFLVTIAMVTAAIPKGLADKGPLEKVTFIHYKKANAKPGTACGNGVCEAGENANKCPSDCGGSTGTSACYAFISSGAKWKTLEPYAVNPSNSQNLIEVLITQATLAGVAEWETYGGNIFGAQSTNYSASYNNAALDNINTLSFGSISSSGAIAVTNVWGYFRGPPSSREIVEWDMLLDQVDFQWGDATVDATKMDVQNIITHELGHSAGLADLYTAECVDETMFGYSTEGETSKRDLNAGDIAGITALYQI